MICVNINTEGKLAMQKISKIVSTPMFRQLEEIIGGDIRSGKYKRGSAIPTAEELCRIYGISEITVRSALKNLVKEGLLIRVPGKGTFVTDRKPSQKNKVKTIKVTTILDWEINDCLKNIMNEYKRVKVVLEKIPLVNYLEKLRENKLPDIFLLNTWQLREWLSDEACLKRILCLDKLTKKNIRFPMKDIFKETISPDYVGKHLYSLPIAFSTVALVYNKSLFDKHKLPYPDSSWRWNKLLEVAIKLTRKNNKSAQYGFLVNPAINRWPILVRQNGGRIISENGKKCLINEKESIQAIKFYADFIHKYRCSPGVGSLEDKTSGNLFATGKIGMAFESTMALLGIKPDKELLWDVAPLPSKKRRFSHLMTCNLLISKNVGNIDTTWDFASYLFSDKVQEKLGLHSGWFPVISHVVGDLLKKYPEKFPEHYKCYLEALEYTEPAVKFPTSEIISMIEDRLRVVWLNMAPVKETCDSIAMEVNKVLSRRKIVYEKCGSRQ